MDDLISRQAAIDVVHRAIYDFFDICSDDDESPITYKDEKLLEINKAITAQICKLPSAQPEITLESAIDYLHSIGWMQEHDRILTESAQPERKRGKWIMTQATDDNGNAYYSCSVCGAGECHAPIVEVPFCWHCGANMVEGEDND